MEVAVGVVFATVVLTTFFRGVPCELEEAARIDGATSGQVLRHVIFPLVAPGIAAVTVLQSVFVWNDYFAPLIVIQKPDLSTVQTGDGELFEFLRDRSSRALCRSCNRDGATAGRVRGPAAEFYPHPGVDDGCVARLGRLGSDRLNKVVKFSCSQWESGTVDGGNDVAIDDPQRLAEFRYCGGMINGEQWAQ